MKPALSRSLWDTAALMTDSAKSSTTSTLLPFFSGACPATALISVAMMSAGGGGGMGDRAGDAGALGRGEKVRTASPIAARRSPTAPSPTASHASVGTSHDCRQRGEAERERAPARHPAPDVPAAGGGDSRSDTSVRNGLRGSGREPYILLGAGGVCVHQDTAGAAAPRERTAARGAGARGSDLVTAAAGQGNRPIRAPNG